MIQNRRKGENHHGSKFSNFQVEYLTPLYELFISFVIYNRERFTNDLIKFSIFLEIMESTFLHS